jgi:hypothetical protein
MDTMDRPKPPEALSAQDFFARDLPGCSMTDAHLATRIAYSTVLDIAHGKCSPRVKTVKRLEQWSREAAAAHGIYLSAARTLGLDAPHNDSTVADGADAGHAVDQLAQVG